MRPIHGWRSRTPAGVRGAHLSSVITTIMDQKVQLLKPLTLRELYNHVAAPLLAVRLDKLSLRVT
jgi:hypothetical protein